MCRQTYLQESNGDADVENWLVDTVGKEKVGQTQKVALMYIQYYV